MCSIFFVLCDDIKNKKYLYYGNSQFQFVHRINGLYMWKTKIEKDKDFLKVKYKFQFISKLKVIKNTIIYLSFISSHVQNANYRHLRYTRSY